MAAGFCHEAALQRLLTWVNAGGARFWQVFDNISRTNLAETNLMTPKDLVVFLEEEAGRSERLAFAANLAELWQAHLIVTFVTNRLGLDRHAGFAVGAALTNMLSAHRAEVEKAKQQTRQVYDRIVANRVFTHEWRVSENEQGEALMLHARHASLAILGPAAGSTPSMTTLGLSEDIIFASGRPSLLVPVDWPAHRLPKRIVVGWNASREATRAIADAMPFLTAAETVHLVVVPEAKINNLGSNPGVDISRHLARHKVPVTLQQLEGRDAGMVLLEHARSLNADLLVMGAYGHSKFSELIFGGVTRTMFATADFPVLLSR
ncbi:MAG TPA: universal stress protein [Hyphomicrobiales bacterium]